jgi:hypothetical protein
LITTGSSTGFDGVAFAGGGGLLAAAGGAAAGGAIAGAVVVMLPTAGLRAATATVAPITHSIVGRLFNMMNP